jgi:AcrR family transcriptional regulator
MAQRAYHHGDLRAAVMRAALRAIKRDGPAALSLRQIAREAGVSHAAPAYHFGDKAGLLTVIATEGYLVLAEATRERAEETDDLIEAGIAYIRFALDHPAHFEVMFRPDLYHAEDPELLAARSAGTAVLFDAVRRTFGSEATEEDVYGGVMAAWSFAHGFASLWTGGNVTGARRKDAEQVARRAAHAWVRLVMARERVEA